MIRRDCALQCARSSEVQKHPFFHPPQTRHRGSGSSANVSIVKAKSAISFGPFRNEYRAARDPRVWALLALLVAHGPLLGARMAADDRGGFGVMVGGVPGGPSLVGVLQDLHASWLRVNDHLDGRGPDVRSYLQSGLGVVVTFNNADPVNVDTTYGSPAQFPNAGFPWRSKTRYQQRIRDALTPLAALARGGGQVWAQCENEISDAGVNPRSRFWRGTIDQYLAQLDACAEAVRSVDRSIPVVLTSFASRTLDAAVESGSPLHADAVRYLTRLLDARQYDAADLHFYGCVEDIAPKIAWVQQRLPRGRRWISTEDGGPDARCRTTPGSWNDNPSRFEQVQAQQVAERLAACADHGGSICLWFSLIDLRGEEGAFTHLGLLDPGGASRGAMRGRAAAAGRGGVRRKPAFDAFQQFAKTHG